MNRSTRFKQYSAVREMNARGNSHAIGVSQGQFVETTCQILRCLRKIRFGAVHPLIR